MTEMIDGVMPVVGERKIVPLVPPGLPVQNGIYEGRVGVYTPPPIINDSPAGQLTEL